MIKDIYSTGLNELSTGRSYGALKLNISTVYKHIAPNELENIIIQSINISLLRS
jgi:hypothetical protein